MTVALYSPEDVVILLGGIYQIEGLHEGSFISIAEDGDRWTTSVTPDGQVSRTHNKLMTHSISLTLSSVADDNSILSAWASADGILYGAMFPIFIKDTNGNSMFYAPVSWIEKVPSATFSGDVESREWIIKAAGATSLIGGNEEGATFPTNLASLGFIAADFGGLL